MSNIRIPKYIKVRFKEPSIQNDLIGNVYKTNPDLRKTLINTKFFYSDPKDGGDHEYLLRLSPFQEGQLYCSKDKLTVISPVFFKHDPEDYFDRLKTLIYD